MSTQDLHDLKRSICKMLSKATLNAHVFIKQPVMGSASRSAVGLAGRPQPDCGVSGVYRESNRRVWTVSLHGTFQTTAALSLLLSADHRPHACLMSSKCSGSRVLTKTQNKLPSRPKPPPVRLPHVSRRRYFLFLCGGSVTLDGRAQLFRELLTVTGD